MLNKFWLNKSGVLNQAFLSLCRSSLFHAFGSRSEEFSTILFLMSEKMSFSMSREWMIQNRDDGSADYFSSHTE